MGAIAVHPSRRFLAVAEKCRHRSPNVYVYTYPSLTLVKVMKGGTERSYRCATRWFQGGPGHARGGCVEEREGLLGAGQEKWRAGLVTSPRNGPFMASGRHDDEQSSSLLACPPPAHPHLLPTHSL